MTAKEVVLTAKHVALIMEFAAGGNMTAYVAKKSQSGAAAAEGQLFMTEDEARYFYRVRPSESHPPICLSVSTARAEGSGGSLPEWLQSWSCPSAAGWGAQCPCSSCNLPFRQFWGQFDTEKVAVSW